MILDQVKSKSTYKKDTTSEKPLRSILKTVSWRIVGTVDTIAISWLLTGEIETALAIGSVELVTKMILYFGHERLWNMISFGKE
ncbi:DUF2061 domain-containing protein [Salegentibacter mishustinae]|jgi:uncharacterized membrane protein|uniref:DUF2061 domain-containing protein n=1 Tax=Salegentibacter mishustinae TaxID=270918 RepID=A0A0Q9ZQ12_9FLAO|nr:DUF2061 domain-containing protein [Salegentibacter mishustinae]KRG30707.1 hypothetical protein APR42_02265 [Salegentibacter mishustinae]MDX1426186.1 DUF2061 domain-containing protein [Salegentibacter mishustinae]PNW23596.1 hypothetical protein APB85_02260 [Salegentibacter mishustinae]PZX66681.1 putative membrane protein [Salegentibacter mishustinae]UBZ08701.1 DUF2061 domain-containing protein [Salegentibacter mishustinae]|tara:strand:+ start:617 stop:868 length:252 start_codon:yes stop_codon:yes gene_type:complete